MLGLSGEALSITKSVITIVVATITIVFLTFFMLLEGRDWADRFYSILPEQSQPRWRKVGDDIYSTVGGYVTGNILISVIAGASITIVLLIMGVPSRSHSGFSLRCSISFRLPGRRSPASSSRSCRSCTPCRRGSWR